MKLRIGDQVKVITGKDKGKTGEIMRIEKAKSRVVVKGVHIVTKHVKATSSGPGQIVHYEGPVHSSNVMVVCPKTGKRTRIGYSKDEKGNKQRYAKVSKEVLDQKVKK